MLKIFEYSFGYRYSVPESSFVSVLQKINDIREEFDFNMGSNIGDPDTLSIVIDKRSNDLQDFIQILDPPVHLHRQSVTAEYRCTKERTVGVEVIADIDDLRAHRILSKVWKCKANTSTEPRKKRVKLKIPSEFKYNYNYFNGEVNSASNVKLRAWILDKGLWSTYKYYGGYSRSLAKVSYNTSILPPFSRPYVYVPKNCRKWSWDILKIISSRRIPKCASEQETIEVIKYPFALSGLPYGVFRSFPKYTNKDLETERKKLITEPRFTLSIWLHILEYCPGPEGPGRFCSIMFHIAQNTEYRTPLLFLTPDGRFHIQTEHTDGQSSAGVTHIIAPKNQWIRIVFTFDNQSWKVTMNYGKNFNETIDADFTHPGQVYMDDSDGLFVFGGTEGRNSFKGYIGQATFYRGRAISAEKIPLPSLYHPMFELQLTSRDEKCQAFLDWIDFKAKIFREHKLRIILKRSCANSLFSALGFERVETKRNTCDKHRYRRSILRTLARNTIKKVVSQGVPVEHVFIGDALYANATAMIDSGIEHIPEVFPLLKQAACCGNLDAMYMVAVILSNGIHSKADDIQAHAYLMKATMGKHRLSSLAMGHKHRYGIDGVPQDLEQTYAYHEYVAETTREDKELHKDTDVFTESVRLTDEAAIKAQTEEDGDLFNWIKHQAKQGVLSAQNHAGRALYWGSQGLKRNLGAALEYFRMSAETEDPQSMYDYGIVLLRGQGTEKNVKEGLHQLKKSAEKKNPAALNALGWYALNKDRNYTAAAQYFEESYAGHNPDAAFHLGHMYLYGIYPGSKRDRDKALQYFAVAGTQGQIDAGVAFAHLSILGTPRNPRNIYIAAEWARFIAEKNPAIGYVLRKGIQAYRRDQIDVSLFYYFMAAEAGVEVGSFNVAWLCEENQDGITSFIEKDCQWRHYNLSTSREIQFVDSYALIKMGDYYWYGCSGQKDSIKASDYYAEAARKEDPQALFNLGFMLEEGARIPRSILDKVPIPGEYQQNNITMLEYLYNKCKESPKSEAFLPCRIALWRVQMLEFWKRYQTWIEVSGLAGIAAVTALSMYLIGYTHLRRQNNDLTDTI